MPHDLLHSDDDGSHELFCKEYTCSQLFDSSLSKLAHNVCVTQYPAVAVRWRAYSDYSKQFRGIHELD